MDLSISNPTWFSNLGETTGHFGTVIIRGGDEIDETTAISQASNAKGPSTAPGLLESPCVSASGVELDKQGYFTYIVLIFFHSKEKFHATLFWKENSLLETGEIRPLYKWLFSR